MKTPPFPTPETLQWAAETIHKTHPDNLTVTQLPKSIAGNPTARLTHNNTDIVVKQLTEAWNFNTEAIATQAASTTPGSVQHIHHDEALRVIATQYHHPTQTEWTEQDYRNAVETLNLLPQTLTQAPIRYEIMSQHEGDTRRRHRGLTVLTANPNTRSAHAKHAYEAIHQINTIPAEALQPSHTDTYPANWIKTSPRPILIDYGTVALAPTYWDAATLTLTLPITPTEKNKWAENSGINPDDIKTVAYYMLPAYIEATLNHGTLHAEWGTRMTRTALEYLTYNP